MFSVRLSVDNVIFGFSADDLKVLLIKRTSEPYKDTWALPGDLVNPDEDLDEAPQRILLELTGLTNVFLEQVHTFGKVSRHPQGRVITVAYYSLVNNNLMVLYEQKTATFYYSLQKYNWIILALESVDLCLYFQQ